MYEVQLKVGDLNELKEVILRACELVEHELVINTYLNIGAIYKDGKKIADVVIILSKLDPRMYGWREFEEVDFNDLQRDNSA